MHLRCPVCGQVPAFTLPPSCRVPVGCVKTRGQRSCRRRGDKGRTGGASREAGGEMKGKEGKADRWGAGWGRRLRQALVNSRQSNWELIWTQMGLQGGLGVGCVLAGQGRRSWGERERETGVHSTARCQRGAEAAGRCWHKEQAQVVGGGVSWHGSEILRVVCWTGGAVRRKAFGWVWGADRGEKQAAARAAARGQGRGVRCGKKRERHTRDVQG